MPKIIREPKRTIAMGTTRLPIKGLSRIFFCVTGEISLLLVVDIGAPKLEAKIIVSYQ
jgi:hypothetical protein